jgi:hypothetical protein
MEEISRRTGRLVGRHLFQILSNKTPFLSLKASARRLQAPVPSFEAFQIKRCSTLQLFQFLANPIHCSTILFRKIPKKQVAN